MVHERVMDLPPNATLRETQQKTHGLVQLVRATTPDVPNQTPMLQLPNSKGHRNLWIVIPYPQLKGPLNLWIVWCGNGVRQSREDVENGHGWGVGPQKCPVHARRANAPPDKGVALAKAGGTFRTVRAQRMVPLWPLF